jgi:hypothetical protein
MSWNMKKISAYKRRVGLIAIIVVSVYTVSGLRLFCADDFHASLRVYGSNAGSIAASASGIGNTEFSADGSMNLDAKRGTIPCSCKKKKKCPAIPRAAIIPNPGRASEFERLTKSVCCGSSPGQITDDLALAGGYSPFPDACGFSACHSFTPLALTCVLLI